MESSNSFDSAVGDIKILEVNQDGKYVRLVNDGKQVIYNFMIIWSIYNCLISINHMNMLLCVDCNWNCLLPEFRNIVVKIQAIDYGGKINVLINKYIYNLTLWFLNK